MGARVLAEGKPRVMVLTTKPADPAKPTKTELDAGIYASPDILTSDFNWSTSDSDKIAEKPLDADGNANAIGASNYNTGLTLWRKFDPATGAPDLTSEKLWEALKAKGATVWIYVRETGKASADEVEAEDEIYLGGEVVTDSPQRTEGSGFIKRRVPLEAQRMHENIKVAAGA